MYARPTADEITTTFLKYLSFLLSLGVTAFLFITLGNTGQLKKVRE